MSSDPVVAANANLAAMELHIGQVQQEMRYSDGRPMPVVKDSTPSLLAHKAQQAQLNGAGLFLWGTSLPAVLAGGRAEAPAYEPVPYMRGYEPVLFPVRVDGVAEQAAPNAGVVPNSTVNASSQYTFNSVENPGPLADMPGRPAANFYSGQYNMSVSDKEVVLYRAGSGAPGSELGQWFTTEPPQSVAQVRIDSAVQPHWIDPTTGVLTGESPIDTVYGIKFPAGTTMYQGPVGYQGGVYLGGPNTNQIFISQPWSILGVQVISRTPLQ